MAKIGLLDAPGWIPKAVTSPAFIHSFITFITEIYIAPLQGYYSEALPTLARLKRRVLAPPCTPLIRIDAETPTPFNGILSAGSAEVQG